MRCSSRNLKGTLEEGRWPHLVQEGLKHVAGLGHRDHTRGARVVDSIVEVIDAARVHNLLAAEPRHQCNVRGYVLIYYFRVQGTDIYKHVCSCCMGSAAAEVMLLVQALNGDILFDMSTNEGEPAGIQQSRALLTCSLCADNASCATCAAAWCPQTCMHGLHLSILKGYKETNHLE